jgi:hypothetical protein
MEYREMIIELLKKIESETILRYIYIIVKDIVSEVYNGKQN